MSMSRWMAPAVLAGMLASGQPAAADAPQPSLNPQRCLALAMYWEAKGEGREGMKAVAAVILNRAAHPEFPGDVCDVIYEGVESAGCQFSWACNGRDNEPVEDGPWGVAEGIALDALKRPLPDPTGGALFFHARSVNNTWIQQRTRTASIGSHIYYR
jgi:N-acetylmuramoyl-L-alanine amidase